MDQQNRWCNNMYYRQEREREWEKEEASKRDNPNAKEKKILLSQNNLVCPTVILIYSHRISEEITTHSAERLVCWRCFSVAPEVSTWSQNIVQNIKKNKKKTNRKVTPLRHITSSAVFLHVMNNTAGNKNTKLITYHSWPIKLNTVINTSTCSSAKLHVVLLAMNTIPSEYHTLIQVCKEHGQSTARLTRT